MKPAIVVLRFVAADGDHPKPERQRYTSTAIAIDVARETFEVRPDLSVLMRDTDGEWIRLFGPLVCPIGCGAQVPDTGVCDGCTKARRDRAGAP